jgi:2-dehydro-3-deoxyphosphogluconate aldolase/(4S)-4-hydroxy-2-oxoglutarate aldolase
MTDSLERRLESMPVVPLVQASDPAVAVAVSRALAEGGLTVVEVVLRTPEALACLEKVATSVPEAITGAGTVLSPVQAEAAVSAGAKFIVSPGLDDDVVGIANKNALPVFPGIATASEAQHAWNLGLRAVKFFPAGQAGGIAMLKALSAVFRDMRFMPTGGVSANNLADFLAVPSVLACGGSWLTPASAVSQGNYQEITRLAAEAVEIANAARG